MCAILGILNYSGKSLSLSAVVSSNDRMRHRGPDDEGYLLINTGSGTVVPCASRDTPAELHLPDIREFMGSNFNAVLAHRRLSILDLSSAGHQPMSWDGGAYWITYNGEIYNYVELREELKKAGYVFRTGTDTEVILASYQHWGDGMLSRFVGMFAFALLDNQKRELWLVRDFFGIKPLYYTQTRQGFMFASEIKALLCLPDVPRQANPQAVFDFLLEAQTDHGPETFFRGIYQLRAGHHMRIPLDRPQEARPVKYWDIPIREPVDLSLEEGARRLRGLFLESVSLHLRSDVPVGTALSGGIDSSSIVMAAREVSRGQADYHSFSYVAENSPMNEERWSDLVAREAKVTIHKIRITSGELVQDLDALINTQDQPFGSTSIYAQNRVFRCAREAGVIVMLDGQGADEILAGYGPGYLGPYFRSVLRRKGLAAAIRLAHDVREQPGASYCLFARHTLYHFFPVARRWVARKVAITRAPSWISWPWFAKQGIIPYVVPDDRIEQSLLRSLKKDTESTVLPCLLRYEDHNSMAYSLESRVPFLNHRIVEFLIQLPEEHFRGPVGTSKYVFRAAMRGIVPDAVLDRRDKIGFATPERMWLNEIRGWGDSLINGDTARRLPVWNSSKLRRNWENLKDRQGWSTVAWRWLNLIRWSELFSVEY